MPDGAPHHAARSGRDPITGTVRSQTALGSQTVPCRLAERTPRGFRLQIHPPLATSFLFNLNYI